MSFLTPVFVGLKGFARWTFFTLGYSFLAVAAVPILLWFIMLLIGIRVYATLWMLIEVPLRTPQHGNCPNHT